LICLYCITKTYEVNFAYNSLGCTFVTCWYSWQQWSNV